MTFDKALKRAKRQAHERGEFYCVVYDSDYHTFLCMPESECFEPMVFDDDIQALVDPQGYIDW